MGFSPTSSFDALNQVRATQATEAMEDQRRISAIEETVERAMAILLPARDDGQDFVVQPGSTGALVYECSVCFCEGDIGDDEHLKLQCGHDICKGCLGGMLQTEIEENKMAKVPLGCPMRHDGCRHHFTREEVHHWLSVTHPIEFTNDFGIEVHPNVLEQNRALHAKYDRFMESNEAKKDPDVRWCIKPGCGAAMHREGNNRLVQCQECGTKHCFNCRGPYHEWWQTCQSQADAALEAWAKEKGRLLQSCPRCGSKTEKVSGCPHMTCACGYEYCWVCRGPAPCLSPHPFVDAESSDGNGAGQHFGELRFRLDVCSSICVMYGIIAVLILLGTLVPVAIALCLLLALLTCCCACGRMSYLFEDWIASDPAEIPMYVMIGWAVVLGIPIMACLIEAVALILSLLILPVSLSYIPFAIGSLCMGWGFTTCCIPGKTQPILPVKRTRNGHLRRMSRAAQVQAFNRNRWLADASEELVDETGASEEDEEECMQVGTCARRYVDIARRGWAFLWLAVAFPICFVLSIALIPVCPLLLVPKLIVGNHRAPFWLAALTGIAATAGTFATLYYYFEWPLATHLEIIHMTGISVAAGAGMCLMTRPPASNLFYFVAALWYGVISPVSTIIHGWSQARATYGVFGPVDYMKLPLLFDAFTPRMITGDRGLELTIEDFYW